MFTSSLHCPGCGHALLTVDLPTTPQLQALAPIRPGRDDVPLLLRIGEAAKLPSLSRSTVYQLMAKGEIAVVRLGRATLIPRRELDRLVERKVLGCCHRRGGDLG